MPTRINRPELGAVDPVHEIRPVAGKLDLAKLDSSQFKAEVGKSRVIEAVHEHFRDLGVDFASITFGLGFSLDW